MRWFYIAFVVVVACGDEASLSVPATEVLDGNLAEDEGSAGMSAAGMGSMVSTSGSQSTGDGGVTILLPPGDSGAAGTGIEDAGVPEADAAPTDAEAGTDASADAGADTSVVGECTNGATKQCGSDRGECEFGTRTCVDGFWGECEGGTGPALEICNSGFDEDCDGEDARCNTPCSVSLCNDGDPCTIEFCSTEGECLYEVDTSNDECVGGLGQGCNPEPDPLNGYWCDGARLICDMRTESCEACGYLNGPCCTDGFGDQFCDVGACNPCLGGWTECPIGPDFGICKN